MCLPCVISCVESSSGVGQPVVVIETVTLRPCLIKAGFIAIQFRRVCERIWTPVALCRELGHTVIAATPKMTQKLEPTITGGRLPLGWWGVPTITAGRLPLRPNPLWARMPYAKHTHTRILSLKKYIYIYLKKKF